MKRVFYNPADPYTYDKHGQIIGYGLAISIFPPYQSGFEDLVVKNLDPCYSQSGKIAGIRGPQGQVSCLYPRLICNCHRNVFALSHPLLMTNTIKIHFTFLY